MAPTQSCLLLSAQFCGLTFYPTPQEHLTSQLILTAMITKIEDGSLRNFFLNLFADVFLSHFAERGVYSSLMMLEKR